MTVYQHRASVTTASGSTSSTSLRIPGGLLRQVFILANTSTTVFRANMSDGQLTILNWGFHTGQLVDNSVVVPVSGTYILNITNASPDDTFSVLLGVQE